MYCHTDTAGSSVNVDTRTLGTQICQQVSSSFQPPEQLTATNTRYLLKYYVDISLEVLTDAKFSKDRVHFITVMA